VRSASERRLRLGPHARAQGFHGGKLDEERAVQTVRRDGDVFQRIWRPSTVPSPSS